jgi:hypothetical protein
MILKSLKCLRIDLRYQKNRSDLKYLKNQMNLMNQKSL